MAKISNKEFTHWHVHSEYSAFDGLSQISEIDVKKEDRNSVLTARKMGFPSLAITDHGTVSGWIKHIRACTATKDKSGTDIPYDPIKPILGAEFYLARKHDWQTKEFQPDGKSGNRHLNIFARNWKGYQNLATLSEKSWLEGFYHNPRIDLELLAEHSEGLMVGTACLSSLVNSNLLYGRYDSAKQACTLFKDIFGEHFFLEAMYHGIAAEGAILPDIFKLSAELDIPVVATNDAHYIHKEDAKTQEVLMCMSTSRCLNDPKHIRFPYGEFYLKDAEEMQRIFKDTPQALWNSVSLLDHIDDKDISKNLFGGMRLPHFELPDGFTDPFVYLRHLAEEGMKRTGWISSEKHRKQLEIEMTDIKVALDINKYDFATYFLIVRDYINAAKSKGIISGAGRGSGYASVLLRCLGITSGLDPMEYGLLWERFLGFDTKRFLLESDFGFENELVKVGVEAIEVDREVEDDFGGVDRY